MSFKPFSYAKSSEDRLQKAHPDLKIIFGEVKKYCTIDFDISFVYRTAAEQIYLFQTGKSELNGTTQKSKHQYLPSEAVDIYAYTSEAKTSYSQAQMCYIAGVIQATALMLFNEGRISHIIRWGGNWDQDGEILTDQIFQDLCHFEIVGV